MWCVHTTEYRPAFMKGEGVLKGAARWRKLEGIVLSATGQSQNTNTARSHSHATEWSKSERHRAEGAARGWEERE